MTDTSFYVPEDLMKAEPATELGCSDLDKHICLQHPEGSSPTHLERKEPGMDLKSRAATILHEEEEEKRRSARKTIQEILLNKSTKKIDLFQDNIFHNQKVHVGDRRWSRHLVAETGRPAKLSAVPTEEVKPSEKMIKATGHSNVEIHLPEVDVDGEVKREMKEETEKGQQELEKRKTEEEIKNDAQEEVCTPPPQEEDAQQAEEHVQELQNLCQTWQGIIQTEDLDEFADIADLAEEMMEELGEPKKDKSVRRRFLNWLNEWLQDRSTRKIARTYRRELEEGDQIYRTSLMAPPVTRAEIEQRKRKKLIYLDNKRKKVKKILDVHWEKQGYQKEALRVKEEERYEKWTAGHGPSIPDSSPEQPKKRMSKWEKRFLRVKEFFSR